MGRKITAAALAAALVLSTSGPIYAQEIRAVTTRVEPVPGARAGVALSLPTVLSPLSPTGLNASLTPGLAPVLSAPSLNASAVPASASLGGHARVLRALPNPVLLPAPAIGETPVAPARTPGAFDKLKAFAGFGPAKTPAQTPAALQGAKIPAASADSVLPEEAASGDAKEFGDAQFRRLGAGDGASAKSGAEPVVAPSGVAASKPGWRKRLGLTAATVVGGGLLAVAQSGSRAAGVIPASVPDAGVSLAQVGQFFGQAGYYVGNILAFVFPLPELYKAVREGKVGAPKWRVGVLVAASLALGVISAPVGGLWFWGIQNIFGAAVIMSAWPAARWGRKAAEKAAAKGEGAALSRGKTLAITVAAVLASLAAAAGLYFAAAAALPAALTAMLGAAGVASLVVGIQAVTGGAYFLLFLPDVISIMRGQTPKGFTPGFSLMFLLASVGFVVWTGHLAWIAEPGSTQRAQFGLYAALNFAYVLVSGASWWISRRSPKTPPSGAAEIVTPPADLPSAAGEPGEGPSERGPTLRLAGLAEAESRAHSAARGRAGHVRLIRVSADLKKGGPRWVFSFHAPAKKQILTYGPRGVEARKYGGDERPMMLHPEQLPEVNLDERLAALAISEPGFKPVRAEVIPAKTGLRVYAYDASGASREAPLPIPLVEKKVPAAEPIVEPIAEPVVEPAVEPVVEIPAVDPVVEKPAELPADKTGVPPTQADADMVREYGPVHDEFPGLPAGMVKVGSEAPASVPLVADAEPKLPRSWRRFPAEAREATSEALLKAKAEAQERARKLAPDARLVSVAINLEDPRSHWIFVFRSDKRNAELTVWTKRVKVRALGFRPGKAPTLWDTRLGEMGPLDKAYLALKKANPRFRPVRVEVDPAWNGPAAYRFLDALGRTAFVGADGKAVFDAAPLAVDPSAKPPRSLENLPADARGADGKSLLALKAEAQERARRLAPDARLVKAAINLDDPRSHWIFVFRSDKRREELTVWTKRIEARRLRPGTRRIPTLWDARLEKASSVAAAYAALKKAKPGLVPVRLELTPTWKGEAVWSFHDSRGRGTTVAAVPNQAPSPAPDPIPDNKGPPVETPPTTETPAPPAETTPAPPQTPEPPAAEPAKPEPPKAEPAKGPIKHIYEDFFGFRSVHGLRRDKTLKPLTKAESAGQVIDQISKQFGIPRERVLELARDYRLNEANPVEDWLGVYDRLQAANRDQFKRLDHKKYSGWKSFRQLANREYPAGWKGALLRISELHKHFVGAAIRFPYHLFDMFIFGYFRQAITFEFRRSTEDFLALTGQDRFAEKWLEAAMRKHAFKGPGAFSGLRAKTWWRAAQRWFVRPLAAPLTTFIARRLTLAVLSAVAMGLLGAFAPVLPLSFSLTAIPVLGPALVTAINGLPVAIAAVPLVGEVLAPVFAAAAQALIKDMVLGPLLQTLILSTLLTLPHAARERVARLRDAAPMAPNLPIADVTKAILGATVSWEFWRSNLKSFFGLITVGAEIEGIMTYADQIDAGVDPVFEKITGEKPRIFHTIGAAVERPEGDSPIPFGGAITWGNVLLFKLQGLLGFNISDGVMRTTMMVKSATVGESSTDFAAHKLSAQLIVGAASQREAPKPGPDGEPVAGAGLPFDADLWKKPMAEALARIEQLKGMAGGLDAEIAAVKEHRDKLLAELGDKKARLALLKKQSKPITDEERAEYERLIRELTTKSDEVAAREKLAEKRDLTSPPSDQDALARLQALQKRYEGMLPPPPPERNGYWEDLAAQDASMKALSQRLRDYQEGRAPPSSPTPAPTLDPVTRDRIAKLVGEIEALRVEARGEIAQRDATQSLLSAANKTRNAALRERRDGKEMLRFHTDMAKLASVMDLALSLNEINAAQAALTQMMALLDAKRAKIAASQQSNQQGQAGADQNAGQIGQWRDEINADIAADDKTMRDIALSEQKTGTSAERFAGFQRDMRAFIDLVNGEDKAGSPDAATEYQRRLDLLPQIKEWRTNGGNPNDPDAFSLKKFNENLAEIDDNIRKAQDGLARLPTVPLEFAGVLVLEIPGPSVVANNPTREQVLQILADRKIHWQGKRADFAKSLATVDRMMDAGNSATVIDEFGDPHPESLPRWKSQSQQEIASAREAVSRFTAQLDANAAQINRVAGSNIPMLSGLGLAELREAIKNYGDSLRAVNTPPGDTLETHMVSMNLILSAKLVTPMAREVIKWAKADATVTAIDEAMSGTLPQVRSGLQGVVGMFDDILADVELDRALIASGAQGGQALIDRKTALLRDKIIPPLNAAKNMLVQNLIPHQQKSIDTVTGPDSDYFKLYDAKKTVIVESVKLYDKTLPWAIATFGAATGDQGEARQNIADWRYRLQKNIDGYDDADGHHKGIREFQVELANRKDPNFNGTETIYGEVQPYSLPKKIAQFEGERTQRAAQINAQDGQINDILARIEALSKGKYNLAAFRLPVGITADEAGVARVQAAVDARAVQNLADELKRIADIEAGASTDLTIGGNSDGTVPSGTQPPITIADSQQIRLLTLDAAKRLVPSSLQQPDSAPAAYAIARFLYSDAVVDAATDGLNVQVPTAERFLDRISRTLGDAIADIPNDEAYAASNGTSESADSVYARKIRVFSSINAALLEGMEFFRIKQQWNRDKFASLDRVQNYYDSLSDIYEGGTTANGNEVEALDTMSEALRKTMKELEEKRLKISSWLNQLNPREKSALNNVSEDISRVMDKTRAVLEANINWHELEDQLARSREILQSHFTQIDEKQNQLAEELARSEVQGQLPADLVRRIEALRLGRGGWASDGGGVDPASIVIRKSEYGAFVDALMGMITSGAQTGVQDLSAIKADLLNNPQGLAALIPNSKVLDFGDTADGFYLVYQSKFSVPHGLETNSWITLGNVGRVFGSNVSVNGYQLASPPSKDGENAPFGDKGIGVQVETLTGKNWVNYLNVDLHRFAFDIPADASVKTGAGESRLMIFDDFAMMLMDDRLYIGLAGFADGAITDTKEKPYYYGGNLKSSLKLTEVMKLNFEQRALFAKDPRQFIQDVNLDFTGFDPDLNRNFRIFAEGEKKNYFRTQVGPQFDLNRLMNPDGGGDTFTLDLYYAKTSGTDDVNQSVGGLSILKGFSIKNDEGKTWMRIDNRLTGELGQRQNEIGDRLSVSFPDQGLVVSAEGKIIGGASSYLFEISKKMGTNSNIALSYGSPYVGMNNRLSLTMNTSFTLAELWNTVTNNAAENLRGGETLQAYNKEMNEFFAGDEAKSSRTAMDLQRVFETDVARKLVTQDIGVLTREIQELRKAGAFMDNSRVRGMVGFVSSAVSEDLAERAVGGGFTVGTYTEMSLTRTQKQLIESKAQILYREGLRLQDRMLSLTKDWQTAVVDIAEAQWALKMANFAVQNAPSEAARREAAVKLSDAESRLHQAVLKYNALTGRDPQSAPPFQDLNSQDLERMLGNLRRLITSPDRLATILKSLDEEQLRKVVGDDPFNLVDWIPWVDKLTVGFGVQFQDMLANQALTVGASVRLPIYDPTATSADKSYALETEAVKQEMAQAYRERTLNGQAAAEQARIWKASADAVSANAPAAAKALSDAIRAYRNGLIGPDKLRAAFDAWNWYMSTTLESLSRSALLKAQSGVDSPFARPLPGDMSPVRLSSVEDAFARASAGSHTLAEIAKRQEAAEEMARAADHRIQKFFVDVNVGIGLTAQGVGWLPSIGITGIPVTPVLGFELKPEEMRELQVEQHGQQAEYYAALKTRVEAGLAVQFYQNMVALRSAESRLAVYDGQLLPKLEREAGSSPAAAQRWDAAKFSREQTRMEYSRARATINLLLGRPAEAPVTAAIDERQALEALSRLLAGKDPVGTQQRILDARVATAKAVEEMVDKNLKVEMLQLEPVSLVVRSLGRLMGALGDDPIYNPELAAAARIQTLTEERERDAFAGRREAEAGKLRLQLNAARDALGAIRGSTDPEAMLEKSRLAAAIFNLQAALLSLGVNPDDGAPAGNGTMPGSWAELTRRLSESEQSLTTVAPENRLDIIQPENLRHRSAAFVRYYFAKQTLGHEPIDQNFIESWVQVRLNDPGTPPEVLIRLAELNTAKADRIYRDALVGAAARADILAAQFEGDVRLLRWVERAIRTREGAQTPAELDAVRLSLLQRLGAQRHQLVARLGLSAETPLSDLIRLVPEDAAPAGDLRELASRLIEDIRNRQIESVRRTLFDGGTPANWGSEDSLMQQIKANTIAERMSYKGFSLVATAGMFRGKAIGGAFLEAPDPREIENGLTKIMSDVLRKELQSTGRLQALTLRLHSMMTKVTDGVNGLEARRKLIEAAESDLRARAEVSGKGSAEYLSAQAALVRAWDDFARSMTATKADFISLVTELEALGEGSTGTLRPFTPPDRVEPRVSAADPKSQLLDYWAGRFSDPAFEASSDALLARMGKAVTAEQRDAIRRAAAQYRTALRDSDAVLTNSFTPAQRLDMLTRADVEGKRLNLRSALSDALRGVGLLDPHSNPVAAEFMAFIRADLEASSKSFALDRGEKVRIARELNEVYWNAHEPTPAEAATFARLAKLDAELEAARDRLLTSYLADNEGFKRFVLKDLELDAYVKAQDAFDRELARVLEAGPSPAVLRALEGLYDLRSVLDRSVAKARHGRGMASLDALIMLETSRLRAARWARQTPARIDPIAESLSMLKDARARWTAGNASELEPLYALTRLDGDRRTWSVDQWLTAEEFARLLKAGRDDPAGVGVIVERGGKYFIDKPATGTTKYEVVGGADAADAARLGADKGFRDNRLTAALMEKMKTADFVAPGAAGAETLGWSFAEMFGPGGLHAQGRVFFFEARSDGKPSHALHPLAALSRAPEEVVMLAYTGDKPLRRDRFPTLRSLESSEEKDAFKTVTVSPKGAAALIENAKRLEASERRRGWIEVKLNSFGFARDEKGQVAQLYRTKDDFEAQWKAYDNAVRDLETAKRDAVTAKAEETARQNEADEAKGADDRRGLTYNVAQARLRSALREAMLAEGLSESSPAFKIELDRRIAEPKFRRLPSIKNEALRERVEALHEEYQGELAEKAETAKAFTEAGEKLKLARARRVNADKAVADAELTLTRSGTWTLHRTTDLTLGLDSDGRLVRVTAAGARGPQATKDLDEAVAGGGPSVRAVTGSLLAAVVDEDGRLRRTYSGEGEIDRAFESWEMRSYRAGGDVLGADADEALTKVRFSHFEETVDGKALPVLLGESFLIDRFESAKSALWKTKHWSYLPFNWGNILLEIPRGVAGIPAELVGGRDPKQHHYLGRAYMYKTEGGATDHHGFFRQALGVLDILNLLPDPVDRFYDPSQFPDVVAIDSPMRPGEGLWNKDLRSGDRDIHLGRLSMQRQVTHAAEDLEAARIRTLSRFKGGVEQLTLETRRGRAGWYQESSLASELGPGAVTRRISDPLIGSDPSSGGNGEVVTSATPGHLFVDKVERRVRIRPGADQYARQGAALDGYSGRVDERGRQVETDRAALEESLRVAQAALDDALGDRSRSRTELEEIRARWNRLAQRIGEQLELEKRIAVLEAEIKALEGRIEFWNRYLRLLEEARRGPSDPNNPDDPDFPKPPSAPNGMFWLWMLVLSTLAAAAAAIWHWLRRRPRLPPPPPPPPPAALPSGPAAPPAAS